MDIFDKCNNIEITDEMVDIKSWLTDEDIMAILEAMCFDKEGEIMIMRLKDGWLKDVTSRKGIDSEDEPHFEELEFTFKHMKRTFWIREYSLFDSKLCGVLKEIIFDYENISQMTEEEFADELHTIVRNIFNCGTMSCETKYI